MDRHLSWEGCWNARDLGGLKLEGGGQTRRGAVVRSESLHRVTPQGWSQIQAYGIRTIVDLRNLEQSRSEPQAPPADITTIQVPLEQDLHDHREFARWASGGLLSTPLYFRSFLSRWPERVADAVAAVARAGPGGVLVHCGKGCDRTGLVVMVLLELVGAAGGEIVADYELTAERLRSSTARRLGCEDDNQMIDAVLAREGTSTRAVLLDTLASLSVAGAMKASGLSEGDLSSIRSRIIASLPSLDAPSPY